MLPVWAVNIRRTRKKQDLSRKGLARMAKVAEGTIDNLESGGGLIDSYVKVCLALGIPPAEMASRQTA